MLAWIASETLGGAAAWGDPEPDDVALLTRTWDRMASGREPLDWVFDIRHLTRISDEVYRRMVDGAAPRLTSRPIGRQAVLVPSTGLTLAIAHGFPEVVRNPRAPRVFHDDAAAFEWLGQPETLRAEIADVTEAARAPGPVTRLRAWLERHLARPELADAARDLAVAPRTLQRQLAVAGTSFRAVVRETRVAVATRLLAEPAAKVDAVALAVGCESTSSFVRLFREVTGETPATWRDRRRERG